MIRVAVELTALAIVRQRRTVMGETVEECIEKAKQDMNNHTWDYQGIDESHEVRIQGRSIGN